MNKFVVLLLVLVGVYFGLKKWSPHTLDKITFWKSKPSATQSAVSDSLPPAEPAPTPAPARPVAKGTPEAPAAPGSTAPVTPGATAPAADPANAKPATNVDKTSQVIVLLYHRFEGTAGGIYSITPELFEEHLAKLKAAGIEIISMSDFFAWRRGEKNIPHKAAVITIDDGYASAYEVARPILKKHGFPWTYFVYTKFVGTGGKSITWEQLAAMREEGIEIGSHSVSHIDLRTTKDKTHTAENYEQWLRDEIIGSKQIIERHIGGKCQYFAYPAGGYNSKVRALIKEAGYEGAFTAYGQRITFAAPSDLLGRYAWASKRPQDMKQAFDFNGPIEASPESPMTEPIISQ
jgi:peptidoglycan/xylan/chitin deacetylase (PgdA/CDA1 family)